MLTMMVLKTVVITACLSLTLTRRMMMMTKLEMYVMLTMIMMEGVSIY